MPSILSQAHLTGFKELEAKLKTLGPRVARNVGARALRAGAKPIVVAAKEAVPVRTGKLKKSIRNASSKPPSRDALEIAIGVRPTRSRIAHLIEFGTDHSPAQPFLRPALDQKAAEAIDAMKQRLWEGIQLEALKAFSSGAIDDAALNALLDEEIV
jgi:HK97 gp10 family phage protein